MAVSNTTPGTYADSSVQRDILNELLTEGEKLAGKDHEKGTGKGVLNSSSPVPQATLKTYADHLKKLSGSLDKVGPNSSMSRAEMSDIEVLIAAVLDKMQAAQESISKNKVNLTTEKQRGTLKVKDATLDETEKKQEEARKKQEGMSIWQKISLAFQYVAAVLTMVVGAILQVLPGVGQAVGVMMIAAGVVQLALAIDATIQMATGKSLIQHVAKAFGANEEQLQIIDIVNKIVTAIAVIHMSIGMMFIPGAQAASVAQIVQIVSSIITTTMQIASTLGGVANAAVGYSASQDMADAQDLQGDAQELDGYIQVLSQVIDQLIEILKKAGDTFNNAIEDTLGSMNDRSAAAGRTQFAG